VGRLAIPQRSRSKAAATRAATAAATATAHALLWAVVLHVPKLPAVPALSVASWLAYTTLLAPMVRMPAGVRSSTSDSRLLLPATLFGQRLAHGSVGNCNHHGDAGI
jgi:hypothetical protein